MDLTIVTGLYIYKNYDPFSDGVFKSIMQLCIDENGNLYMNLLNGFLHNVGFDITYKELENNFIPIRLFLDDATYIGYNAQRLLKENDDINDLNFTGYVDENTKIITKDNQLLKNKLQVILYKDDSNMLIYYCDDIKKLKIDSTYGLRFVNEKYVQDNYWNLLEDYRGLYINKNEIMMDLYEIDEVKSKQMIIR